MTIENETWLIEAGDIIVQKKVRNGFSELSFIERLIYCVWVADYGMRNAGDLVTASDLYPDFHTEASRLAKALALPFTLKTFSLDRESLTTEYFDRFDDVCNELRKA